MTSIFVAKLDYGVSQEELKSVFERFGKVNKVTIAIDRETGKPRGFAFVEMFDDNEAQQAINQLEGYVFNGRPVSVKKAEDRGNSRDSRPAERKPYSPDSRPEFKKPEFGTEVKAPVVLEADPLKLDARKKELPKKKEKAKDFSDGKPRQQKMQAYKKSGKNNRFLDFDDDDDF
ncbi:MAG: RNA recognition motif domain-containing protein [Bacteroidota bacterium]